MCKDMSAWIMWCIQEQYTWLLRKGSTQFVGVQCPGRRMQRHIERYGIGHDDIWHIRIIKWLDGNHLIARINEAEDCRENTLSCSCCNDNSSCWIDIQRIEPSRMIGNGAAQRRSSRARGILVMLSVL